MKKTNEHLSKKITKVLIITTAFPRWEGDSQAPYLLDTALALCAVGIQVRVLAMHTPGCKTFEVIQNVEIHRPRYFFESLEILRKDPAGLPEFWKKQSLGRLLILPFLITHTVNLLRLCRDVDIIHANWTLSGMIAWGTRFLHHKPVVLTVHGSDILRLDSYKFVRKITSWFTRHINGVICVSCSLAQKLREWGVPEQHLEVIPNGVDTRKFIPSNNKKNPIILYVGTLTENKGVHYLINAFKMIAANIPEYRLQIIGEGEYLPSLIQLCKGTSIENRIEFTGAQSPNRVAEHMRNASILVLPSLSEGLGVVLIEALASGVPVVGTNVGGIPDIITSEVGKLVPAGDAKALAKSLLELISELPQVNYSANARKRAEALFSWDIITPKILNFYERVINQS